MSPELWEHFLSDDDHLGRSLCSAVRTGDTALLQEKLKELETTGHTKISKEGLLHCACGFDQPEICRILLRAGTELLYDYDYGPVHLLNEVCTADVARVFVEEKGLDVLNEPYDLSGRLLHPHQLGWFSSWEPQFAPRLLRAAIERETDFCKDLLQLGADPNCQGNDGDNRYSDIAYTPLDAAVVTKDEELVSVLLKHGAKCDESTIHIALYSNDDQILNILRPHAKQEWYESELMKTILDNRPDHTRKILEKGVIPDVNKKCIPTVQPTVTPLEFAMFRGNLEIAKVLLEHGADPYREEDQPFANELQLSIMDDENLVFLKELFLPLWPKRYPRGKDQNGDTILHLLCETPNASLEAFHLVLDHQPNNVSEPEDMFNELPVFVAAMNDQSLDIIFSLLTRYPEAVSLDNGNPIYDSDDYSESEGGSDSVSEFDAEPDRKRKGLDEDNGGAEGERKRLCSASASASDDRGTGNANDEGNDDKGDNDNKQDEAPEPVTNDEKME